VNLSIIEMDGMTQQNAALVEQAAAAFQSLQDQASELQRVVSIFKLEEGAEAAAAVAAPASTMAVATRAVTAAPARPQLKKPAVASDKSGAKPAAKAASTKAPAAEKAATSKKVAAAAASDDWEEF